MIDEAVPVTRDPWYGKPMRKKSDNELLEQVYTPKYCREIAEDYREMERRLSQEALERIDRYLERQKRDEDERP